MSCHTPITLIGMNLGARHRYLNTLVNEAYNLREPFEAIIALPEKSPIDRLFKIDLASKLKHVEFILSNLQDDDMLYVSRALKSKWLLGDEYRCFVNPSYLETHLYPHMITTAVNKMKHWIHLNLRDSVRCHEFYAYYFEKDIDYAFKFLCKCPEEIILNEFPKTEMLANMTPHRFKILCERTPIVAKIFFEMLTIDRPLLRKYNAIDYVYFNSLKCIMKTDISLFLDIIEQHFMPHFKRLSTRATKFIIAQRKDRFLLKPEFYTARILNVDTIAECLTQEECEELVIKLARAKYLECKEHWFNYKNVEPLIKRLDIHNRRNCKKKVFVDKDLGEIVADWPYQLPVSLYDSLRDVAVDHFVDEDESPAAYDRLGFPTLKTERILKAHDHSYSHLLAPLGAPYLKNCVTPKPKTQLDALFDEYRFTSFDKTLFELRKRITSESSSQNRMYMMLVLVSKSGGKADSLYALLHFLMEHRNEPPQVRASVIRSLVKRACVWRVEEDIWKDLLIFGRGLGMEGETPEADCDEGLHAVVIRNLLSNRDFSPAVKKAFIKNFSPLTNYSLKTAEKELLNKALLNILLESANEEVNAHFAGQILGYALDTLKAYNIKLETRLDVIESIKTLQKKDQVAAISILKRFFDAKLGRKELFRENFDLIQSDASYENALKHNITILSIDKFLKAVLSDELNAERFLRKMSIYFNENEGLARHFLIAIRKAKIHKRLARPLAYLLGDDLKSYMLELNTNDMEDKRFSAFLRANAHLARPALNINSLEWRTVGAKLIANRVLKCKAVNIDQNIKQLLTWKRTVSLAIILAQRTDYEADIFASVAKIRPTVALKTALKYFRKQRDQSNPRVWDIVKPLLSKLKVTIKTSHNLMHDMKKIDLIPLCIRPQYATEVFKVINENSFNQSISVLCHIKLLLPNIEEEFIEAVLYDFIENRFCFLTKKYDWYDNILLASLFFKILCKYLLVCKSEDIQNRRFKKIGQLYLDRLQSYWKSDENKTLFFKYLDALLYGLKNNEVFLNEEYVSCLPVMEKFVKWMQGFLPMERYFHCYQLLHLIMLYYKAIRQTNKQMPGMLTNERTRRNEGHKIVGETFGKYIGREARVLTKNYFDSIIVLYCKGLNEYIRNFNREKFGMFPYVVKGIIEVSEGIECTLALCLYKDNKYFFTDDEKEEICKCLKQMNRTEMQFYYNEWKHLSRF